MLTWPHRGSVPLVQLLVASSFKQHCASANDCYDATMMWGSSPSALANRFNTLAQNWVADGPAARAERARRKLLSQIGAKEPPR